MSTSPEIEQIIRLVFERLATAGDLMAGVERLAQPPVGELVVMEPVVTLASIEKRLEGKQRVRVSPRAVVTPAVRDLLRSQKIELVRDTQRESAQQPAGSQKSASTAAAASQVGSSNVNAPMPPVLVCGDAAWFASLPRHLCPRQATVQTCNDLQASGLIATHLHSGGVRAIWISATPFAASLSAAKTQHDAVLLPSLRETSEALSQANPRVVVVDASRWTVAAIGNLVRTLIRSH